MRGCCGLGIPITDATDRVALGYANSNVLAAEHCRRFRPEHGSVCCHSSAELGSYRRVAKGVLADNRFGDYALGVLWYVGESGQTWRRGHFNGELGFAWVCS